MFFIHMACNQRFIGWYVEKKVFLGTKMNDIKK